MVKTQTRDRLVHSRVHVPFTSSSQQNSFSPPPPCPLDCQARNFGSFFWITRPVVTPVRTESSCNTSTINLHYRASLVASSKPGGRVAQAASLIRQYNLLGTGCCAQLPLFSSAWNVAGPDAKPVPRRPRSFCSARRTEVRTTRQHDQVASARLVHRRQ